MQNRSARARGSDLARSPLYVVKHSGLSECFWLCSIINKTNVHTRQAVWEQQIVKRDREEDCDQSRRYIWMFVRYIAQTVSSIFFLTNRCLQVIQGSTVEELVNLE